MLPDVQVTLKLPQLSIAGLVLLCLVLLLVWVIKNPDKAERIHAWVCFLFRWAGRRYRLGYVARDIQARIQSACRELNREAPGLCPEGIRIEWVRPKDVTRQSFVKDGVAVIRLNDRGQQDRNFVAAVLDLVRNGVLRHARSYLYPEIGQAVDFGLAKLIIVRQRPTAVDDLFRDVLEPALDSNPDLRPNCAAVDAAAEHGWLLPVFLREIQDFADRHYPRLLGPEAQRETGDLLTFVYDLASRAAGEDTPLDFPGKWIRLAVVLVAEREKLQEKGTAPHRRAVERRLNSPQFDTVYVQATGRTNADAARALADQVRAHPSVASVHVTESRLKSDRGRVVPLICIRVSKREVPARAGP
jgi:hypothetical protein